MERLWRVAFAVGGVAAVGAFVFWSLYKQWLSIPIFSKLTADQTFILMLMFLVLTFLSLVGAFILHAIRTTPTDSVLGMYEQLRHGLTSPEENFAQIERIANSSDPKRFEYLSQVAQLPNISFAEVSAIDRAIADGKSNKRVENLKGSVARAELERINQATPRTSDPLFHPIVSSVKYWRYVNRKNNPQYGKVEKFIAIALAEGFSPKALALSKELQAELESATRSMSNT